MSLCGPSGALGLRALLADTHWEARGHRTTGWFGPEGSVRSAPEACGELEAHPVLSVCLRLPGAWGGGPRGGGEESRVSVGGRPPT